MNGLMTARTTRGGQFALQTPPTMSPEEPSLSSRGERVPLVNLPANVYETPTVCRARGHEDEQDKPYLPAAQPRKDRHIKNPKAQQPLREKTEPRKRTRIPKPRCPRALAPRAAPPGQRAPSSAGHAPLGAAETCVSAFLPCSRPGVPELARP